MENKCASVLRENFLPFLNKPKYLLIIYAEN